MLVLGGACADSGAKSNSATTTAKANASPPAAATPAATPFIPKDGNYDGRGVVTKLNLGLGSVEVDHEEIKGLMPKMIMEFYVTEKSELEKLKIGDRVEFVIEYKNHQEKIISIKKAK